MRIEAGVILRGVLFAAIFVTGLAAPVRAQDALPGAPFLTEPGWRSLLSAGDLSGWHAVPGWRGDADHLNEWFRAASVSWPGDSAPLTLVAEPAPGPLLVNGIPRHTSNLVSDAVFGDVELYVEFLLARQSNSGVYLHGLYEVQIMDSWGAKGPWKASDGGGIYERWDNGRGFEGSPPRVNASRAPGQWQSYHIWFRAPRFQSGTKVANAKFLRVVYNGVEVQRDYECTGPTRSSLEIPEAPVNPIMLQGDHGPVAFRNLYVRKLP